MALEVICQSMGIDFHTANILVAARTFMSWMTSAGQRLAECGNALGEVELQRAGKRGLAVVEQ